MNLGLFRLLLLLRIILIGADAQLDKERCRSTLGAILSSGGEDPSLSWGDIAVHYKAAVCGDQWSEAKDAQQHKALETILQTMERRKASSVLPLDSEFRRQQLCNLLDAFVIGVGCNETQGDSYHRRRVQDETCALDLLNFVENDTDGQLNLIEYNHFFTSRYYSRCGLSFDIDDTTGVSATQSDAFVSLACLTCLREIGTVTTLPDCCQPEQATISLRNPDAFTFARICTTARAAAAEDCSHLSLLTTARPQAPQPTSPPLALPPISFRPPPVTLPTPASTPATSPMSPLVDIVQPLSECGTQLVLADSSPSDGTLSSSEFTAFLVHRFGHECVFRHPEMAIQGLFLQLACSSCLSGIGATLDCCLPAVAKVSVDDAYNGVNSNWINRICFNADAQVEATCHASSVTSPVTQPPPPPQNAPRPTTPNVVQPQIPSPVFRPIPPTNRPPVLLAPVQIPSMVQFQSPTPSRSPIELGAPTSLPSSLPVDMGRHSSPSPTQRAVVAFPTRSPIEPIVITAEPSTSPKAPIATLSPVASAEAPDERVNATTTVASNTTTTSATTFSLPPIPTPVQTSSAAPRFWIAQLVTATILLAASG